MESNEIKLAFEALERANRAFHLNVDYTPGEDSSPGAIVSSVKGAAERLLGMRRANSEGRSLDLSTVFPHQSYESLCEFIDRDVSDCVLQKSLNFLLAASHAVYVVLPAKQGT